MATQVDPAAYQNAFYAHQDFTLRNRLAQQQQAQQGVENERQNRLLALNEGQLGLQRQRFDADQQQQQRQNDIAERERISKLIPSEYAPMASKAIASGKPRAYMASLLAQPWAREKFRADGIFDPDLVDVNAPDFVQGLEVIAGMSDMGAAGSQSPYGKVNPGDFTPQSLAAYAQTVDPRSGIGDFRLLERTWAPPSVSVQRIGGALALVDPGNRLGGGRVQPLSTAQAERDAAAQRVGAETGAREGAQRLADRQADLPRIEQNASEALSVIDQLLASPGLPYITGIFSKAPIVPNTEQAAADALARQVEGKVFMEAFTTLKGGGQITEKEGEKATAALARLNRAQKIKDYRAAAMELREIIETGRNRARTAAGVTQAPQAGGWSVEVVP